MRGSAFHNNIVDEAKATFNRYHWQVYTEYRYRKDSVTTYLDLFAAKDNRKIACEVETTPRHIIDNALKARSVNLTLWIIVPSRRLRRQAEQKLTAAGLLRNESLRLLLPGQLEAELINISKH